MSDPFYEHDELGLFALQADKGIPYVAVKLTAEQAELVALSTMEFYSTNDKTLFEVKDKDGNNTGEFMFFVMFRGLS